jgi:hypothetical protein
MLPGLEEEKTIMSITSGVFAWRKGQAQVERRAKTNGTPERFPSHTRAILPDGSIMLVRVASLAAAKDLLAAQRAAERKLTAQREARMMREVAGIVEAVEQSGTQIEDSR